MEASSHLETPSAAVHQRACANCARAKAKCIPGRGGKCHRCDRLNKQCEPAVPVRKRATKKTSTHSTARLEEKLDGLVSLLKSSAQAIPPATTHSTSAYSTAELQQPVNFGSIDEHKHEHEREHHLAVSGHIRRTTDVADPDRRRPFLNSADINLPDSRTNRLSDGQYDENVLVDPPNNFFKPGYHGPPSPASTSHHTPDCSTNKGFYPSTEEAERLLELFRTQMLGHFPFMVMPRYDNARQFQVEHPFLWLCIMCVTSGSTEQQQALGKEVRVTLGRKMLVEGERSLDLLFGILVYTGWAQLHCLTNPIVTNLVQLAIGLLGDLTLNKPPTKQTPHVILNYDARGCPRPFTPHKRTMEERRAAVGLFWISSVISTYFQRIESLRWSQYLNECLDMLAETRECTNDLLLVQLVRLQQLIERANEVSYPEALGDPATPNSAPLRYYVQTLISQMDEIRRNVPLELQHNETLLLHLHSTDLSIHETVLTTMSEVSNKLDFWRVNSLFSCLRAIKDWTEQIIRIPPAKYVTMSISIFTHLAHCIITLYRLLALESPDWDRGLAKDMADWPALLGSVIERMKDVKNAAGIDVGRPGTLDVYSATAQRLHTIKECWDAKMAADAAPPTSNTGNKDDCVLESVDDAWLKDILGMEDYQFESYMQPF